MGIVVVKLRLQMEEPANVGRHNPHMHTLELQRIINYSVLVTIIIVEILIGNQVVFGATQQIFTSVGNIVTHCIPGRILLKYQCASCRHRRRHRRHRRHRRVHRRVHRRHRRTRRQVRGNQRVATFMDIRPIQKVLATK